ncbi:MAG: hypothetical protein IPM66_04375 [Acidobacteriota bacterium]|nr:MAG: hypothetical protein IPM66_04375 [Acidobacteriota bacterium]
MMLPALMIALLCWTGQAPAGETIEYRLLATNKTSTMEKEMNQAAAEGFKFEGTMGGETAGGGSEIVVIMSRRGSGSEVRYEYRLLATNKTSTMEKEMNRAGAEGYFYKGQTVYNTAFGGREVVVILEHDRQTDSAFEYKLLATNRTSTMEKEINREGQAGFEFLGITVAQTSFGGREVVSILWRKITK